MNAICRLSVLIAFLLLNLATSSAESPTALAGFQVIFNGKDLTGWEGSSDYWSVQDGCLTGVTDGSLKYNRFIICAAHAEEL